MIACRLSRSRVGVEWIRRRNILRPLMVACAAWVALVAFDELPASRAAGPGSEPPNLTQSEEGTGLQDGESASILYRRIYVPADHVEAWPRGGDKYLPVEARDFAAWLKAANSAAPEAPAAATIQEAHYAARLEDGRLVDCRGEWRITVQGPRPSFLPLADTSLVVREAHWQGAGGQPARIGAWGRSGGPAHIVGLEVPNAGTLEFSWQAPSRAIHNGTEIEWRLPTATEARLVLDLPNGKEPLVEGGVVLDTHPLPPDAGPDSANRTRWELALNPSSDARLRLVDTAAGPSPSPSVNWGDEASLTLHEDVNYHITQRGLDIEAVWRLDDAAHERLELAVPLPKDVHFLSATLQDRALSWRIERVDLSAANVAIIELPTSTSRSPLEITVGAWQPLRLDRSWDLPKLRPRAVFWQSGDVELSIAPQLEMQALSFKDCLQTGVSRSDGATEPEIARLAMYAPAGKVSVRIARRRAQATIRLGSSLALADPDINGRLVSEWQVSQGSIHKLSGELVPGWVIEAVETTPAEALGEWFIDERGKRRQIEIQLARAVRPGRNVRVTITGRPPRVGLGEPISVETMRIVNWTGGLVARHLLTFQTVEPYAVETTGWLPVVASEAVSEDDRTLVELPSGKETIFDLTRAEDDAGLKLTLERGQYEADIRIAAAYARESISRDYHLTIDPATNGVDRLLIYATAALGDDVRWTEKSLNAPLSAQRLPADDPRWAGLPAGGELWLVRLPGLTTQTVDIRATAVTPWPARKELPLLAMPEALAQHGRVLVRAEMDSMPLLEPQGLQFTALPAEPASAAQTDGLPPVRAAYRYDPTSCLTAERATRLWMGPHTINDTSPLVARHVELESFFWPNGRATHRATYDLENEGAASFDLQLPPGAVIRAVLLDGRVLEQPVDDRAERLPTIRLGTGTRSARVAVHFDTQQQPLAAGSKLYPPLVHQGIPTLAGRWTIWLPEEFSTTGANDGSTDGGFNWRRRLFGVLGRPAKETPFQPLRSRDWARLLNPLGNVSARTAAAKTNLLGWAAHSTSFVAEGPAAVSVAHPPAIGAWAIAIFLLCVVGGKWLRGRSAVFIALLALAAVVALLLPAALAPVATGAVLGLLFSLVPRWPRPASPSYEASDSWSRFSTVSVPGALLVLVAATVVLAEPTDKPAEAPNAAAAAAIERVLIPVDADGRQAGSKLYVSERFLRELLQPRAEEVHANRSWLLLNAVYDGELRESMQETGIVAGEWTMSFDIEVLARDTTVIFPLVRNEATWRDTAMLDGIPVPINWHDDGHGCTVDISEPGRYTLTLSCVPRTAADARRKSVRLTLPPLAGARLRLDYPKSLTGLSVSGAEAATEAADPPGTLQRELDATGELELAWSPGTWTAGTTPSLRVTGMRWLRIGTEEIGLEAKYVVEGNARRPDALVVAFDRRWKLVDDGRSSAEVVDEPDGRRSVRIPLPPEEIDRQEVAVRWRLNGTRALGHLRLPAIELISVPVTNHWLAISTDPTVECEILGGSASPGTANEFLTMWGDADDVPQLVMGNMQSDLPWSAAVRPRQRESTIDEVLHVAAGRDTLRVAYQAEITPGTAQEYQFPLNVPADLSIEEIAGTDGGQDVPVRWARVGETQVNVFFGQVMADQYRLVLSGTVPLNGNSPRSLPRVTAVAMGSASQNVQLYREEDVLVELSGLSDADRLPEGPRELPPPAWTARPAGAYRLDQHSFEEAQLKIAANNVQITGPKLLALHRDPDGWSASFVARLTVQQGQLDTLKLIAPAAWAGPFSIKSDVLAAMEYDAAGPRGPTLLIHFAESIPKGNSVQLAVRGVLAQGAQAPVAVPQITPEPIVQGKHFLQVPSRLDGQPIAWTEAGVRGNDLPNELRDTPGVDSDARTFEIIDPAFRVAVQPSAVPRPSARVRLADTTVWAAASEAQLIETRLVIAAPDLVQCLIELPQEQELVSVHLEGRPAIIQRVDGRRWRVNVGPTQLPQVLEVVSVARGAMQDSRKLQRPRLLDEGAPIPVEVSLWSIGYRSTTALPRVAGAATVSKTEQAAVRLDRLVSIAETATPAVVEAVAPDGYQWFRTWADRLISLRQEAADKLTRSVEGRSPDQVSRAAEEQLNRAAERLDLWLEQGNEQLARPESDVPGPPAAESTEPAATSARSPASRWIYCVAEGGADDLALELVPVTATSRQVRVVGTLAVVCAAVAGVWLMRRPATADFLYRWPHAVAFLVGIAFWAWLWPSWVGILIAAGSLFWTWRLGWPGQPLSLERSTVLRVSRSDVVAP